MICPRCGNSLKHGSRFCSHCGFQPDLQTDNGFGNKPKKPKANNAAWIVGIIAAVMAMAAVILLIFMAQASVSQTLTGTAGGLTAGDSTHVVGGQIGTDGGTISIDEGELSGFSIDVLEDSFGESVQFDISTAPIDSHEFGDIFTAASPLITIDNGGTFADKPMMVTIPIDIEDDEFAMAFFYDEETRALQPMPLFSLTNTELVTMTQHFSDVLVSKIKKKDIVMFYDTGFTPGVNDFQIPNIGSCIAPRGHCAGQCIAMAYYYEKNELNQGEKLYGRFDNDSYGKTPNYFLDDADAIRLSSSIHKDYVDLWDDPTKAMTYFNKELNVTDTKTYYAALYSMMVTEQPQYISARSAKGGHGVLAYKITSDAIYVADPNKPGDAARKISVTQDSNGEVELGKYENGRTYDTFKYYGIYALMNKGKTYGLWREVIDGSPTQGISAADYFPDDILIEVRVGVDENGNDITKPLTDGFLLTEEAGINFGSMEMLCRVTNAKTDDEVYVIRGTGNIDISTGHFYFLEIEKGINHIRILHTKNKEFVNFYRYDLIYGELNPTLTANPNPVETEDEVSFKVENSTLETNFNVSAYTYRWDFGNGVEHTTNGVASNTYFYADEGTYAVSVGIYNQSGEFVGDAQTTVIVTVPEVTPTPSAIPTSSGSAPKETPLPSASATPMAVPSYLCGTWEPKYENGDMLDTDTFDIWRIDQTLEIYEDGTCYYSRIFTNLYKREDETDPNATLPPYDDTCESSALDMTDVKINGQLTLYDEEYSETGAQVIGMITFDYDSRWYDSNLYLDDGKFIFLGVEYIRSK